MNKTNDKTEAVSVNALRGQAMQRLAGVQQKLESQGVGAAFTRAASRNNASNDSGFIGSLVFSMLLGGALSSFIGAHFDLGSHAANAFNHSAMAGVETLSAYRDQKAAAYRSRVLNDYPEGRRMAAFGEAAAARKFNLVSGSQNNRLSFDAQADLACMYEILDMLDGLEKEGVHTLRLTKEQSVYNTLKKTTGSLFSKGAVRSFAAPLAMRV